MEDLTEMLETLQNSQLVLAIQTFNNKYILSHLTKNEFTTHLVAETPSRIITILLAYVGIFLAVYEIGLHSGVYLGLWRNPAHEVFKEIPVHCAHVYISINLLKDGERAPNFLLKNPIVYHFEFSPDEYAHEEFGTDLKFIKNKVNKWFTTSEVYHHNKDDIKLVGAENINFYNKKGKKLVGDDEYLCDLGVDTGDTIFCVIQY